MKRSSLSTVEINALAESRDLDGCLSYLSLVNGIDGAVLYSREALVVGAGQDTLGGLFVEAPYLLDAHFESAARLRSLGLGCLDFQVHYTDEKFHLIVNLNKQDGFYLVVSGTRGSFDLFKFRIERGAQAVVRLLQDHGYLRGS